MDVLCLAVQLAIAAVAGVGEVLTPGTGEATAQLACVLGLQLSLAAYILLLGPAADRMETACSGLQFTIEGALTAVLLVQTLQSFTGGGGDGSGDGPLQLAAFVLGVVALLLPIVFKAYDALVVPLYQVRAYYYLLPTPYSLPTPSYSLV